MDNELLTSDISMTFNDDDTIIRSVSDECDEDEAVLTRLPSHQWRDIMDFLTVEDFKALRLTGSKVSCCMHMNVYRLQILFYALVHMLCSLYANVKNNRLYQI